MLNVFLKLWFLTSFSLPNTELKQNNNNNKKHNHNLFLCHPPNTELSKALWEVVV